MYVCMRVHRECPIQKLLSNKDVLRGDGRCEYRSDFFWEGHREQVYLVNANGKYPRKTTQERHCGKRT